MSKNVKRYNGEFKNDFKVAGDLGGDLIKYLNENVLTKNNSKIIHSEVLNESIAKLLDLHSGIDAVMLSDKGLSGVALRIQKNTNKNWGTFTIRYKRTSGNPTEYQKRIKEIYDGHPTFYPQFTVQAYYDSNDKLLGGAIVKTKTMYDIVMKHGEPFEKNKNGKNGIYLQTNQSDGNSFIVVPFNMLKDCFEF